MSSYLKNRFPLMLSCPENKEKMLVCSRDNAWQKEKRLNILKKWLCSHGRIMAVLIFLGVFISTFFLLIISLQKVEAGLNPFIEANNVIVLFEDEEIFNDEMFIIQNNTISALSNYSFSWESLEKENSRTEKRIITAYSSTVDQTNSEPFITASGAWVRDGIIAANFLSFGTKVRIPEIFGDKIFVVKDRMHSRNSHKIDVWFPSREEALLFGVRNAYIEILEDH